MTIDGYSQPGSQSNSEAKTDDATILIQVNGSQVAGSGVNGLKLEAYNCTVQGLIITGFSGAGISIEPPSSPPPTTGAIGTTIRGNFIGVSQYSTTQDVVVDPTRNPAANQAGIISDFSNNNIGGLLPGDRNVIQGNTEAGVILYGAGGTGNLVQANFILDNGGDGVLVLSANNEIGQPVGAGTAGGGNVISGNHANAVYILGPSARGNIVANDLIGTTTDGTANRPNLGDGVLIENAPGNVVGGTSTNSLNVIAGNVGEGVMIENFQSQDELSKIPIPADVAGAGITVDSPADSALANSVEGDWIGFDMVSGELDLMPNTDGVFVASSGNTVGGSTSAAQNIIIANLRDGVVISGVLLDASNAPGVSLGAVSPTSNVIAGNLIGTESGDDDHGNTLDGVFLYGVVGNTIGGSSSASQNVISGNNRGVMIQDTSSTVTGNIVAGNEIGTNSSGSQPLPNATDGITIDDSARNTIGGSVSGSGNLISGNEIGVHITGAGSSGNVVWGNLIGTDVSGADPIRNTSDGVLIDAGASNNTIGGTVTADENTIAFNTAHGVLVVSGNGDAILTNSIFSNGLIGIMLSDGANDSILPPALTAALPDTTLDTTNIQGTYTGQSNSTYLIQFFSNTTADPSNNYEGQTWIGSTTLKTNASGRVIGNPTGTFSVDLDTVVAAGSWITATVTFLSPPGSGMTGGDTSEFTAATEAINPFLVTTTADTNTVGTLRYAITYSNANPSISVSTPNRVNFQIPGGGLQTIELASILPTIASPLIIDGYSQPGSNTNDSSEFLYPDTNDDQETDIATITVEVDGSEIDGASVDGLVIASPGCTFDGLSITGFGAPGSRSSPRWPGPRSAARSATRSGATSSASPSSTRGTSISSIRSTTPMPTASAS